MRKISKRERGKLGLSIVVPCYNEEESVKAFYNTIIKVLGVEHSSLGNHFIDLLDFRGLTDTSLVNPLKSSKNSKSTTANIRMLLDSSGMESLESKLDSGMESILDSKLFKDSNVESNLDSALDSKLLQKMKTDKNTHRGGAASHI